MWSHLPLAAADAVLPRTTDPTAIWVAAISAFGIIVVAFVGTLRNRSSPAPPAPAPDPLTPPERTLLAVLEVNQANLHGDQAELRSDLAELQRRFNRYVDQHGGGSGP